MNNTYSQVESRHIDIARALSVDLEAGDAVRCVRGQVWLTQESDSRDYCLVAGVRFCADRDGRAVLTALDDEGAAIIVEHRAGVPVVGSRLSIDSWRDITQRARHAQAEWVASAFACALRWLGAQASAKR